MLASSGRVALAQIHNFQRDEAKRRPPPKHR